VGADLEFYVVGASPRAEIIYFITYLTHVSFIFIFIRCYIFTL
jgi:hypothetical protein